jgi:hypothetical protein
LQQDCGSLDRQLLLLRGDACATRQASVVDQQGTSLGKQRTMVGSDSLQRGFFGVAQRQLLIRALLPLGRDVDAALGQNLGCQLQRILGVVGRMLDAHRQQLGVSLFAQPLR